MRTSTSQQIVDISVYEAQPSFKLEVRSHQKSSAWVRPHVTTRLSPSECPNVTGDTILQKVAPPTNTRGGVWRSSWYKGPGRRQPTISPAPCSPSQTWRYGPQPDIICQYVKTTNRKSFLWSIQLTDWYVNRHVISIACVLKTLRQHQSKIPHSFIPMPNL